LNKPASRCFAEHVGGAALQAGMDEYVNVIDASADNWLWTVHFMRRPKVMESTSATLDQPQRNLVLKKPDVEGGEAGLNSVTSEGGQVNPQPVIEGLLLIMS